MSQLNRQNNIGHISNKIILKNQIMFYWKMSYPLLFIKLCFIFLQKQLPTKWKLTNNTNIVSINRLILVNKLTNDVINKKLKNIIHFNIVVNYTILF